MAAHDEKVLGTSDIAYDSSLDIFETPISNLGVADTKWVSFKPANAAYSIEGDIKFHIPTSENSYFDLRELRLRTLVRIVQGNGRPLPPQPKSKYAVPPADAANPDFPKLKKKRRRMK